MKRILLVTLMVLCICGTTYAQDEDSAEKHFKRGNTFARQGKFQEAIAEFQKTIQTNPNYREIYSHLGSAYSRTGDFKKAITAFEKAIELNPNDTLSLAFLGNLYFKIGENKKAEEALKHVLKLSPGHHQLLSNTLIGLVNICEQEGRYKEAINYAERILSLGIPEAKKIYVRDKIENLKKAASISK